jgi:hypothetical protein
MMTSEQKKLAAAADKLLQKAGLKPNGQPKQPKTSWDFTGKSVRTISVPMGGKPGYRRH